VGENLSTAVLLAAVIYVMMILGGIAWRRMLALTGVVAVVGVFAVLLLLLVPSQTLRDSPIIPSRAVTWQARIQDFSNSNSEAKQTAEEYARLTATDKPQETHANIAIATSNVFGKMPGNSDERDYLQEASCDFIYAIIIEELGMVGGIVVMLVYMILLFRVGRIATRCKEKYPAYLAMGIGMLLGLQAFINMSVAVGLFPVTGQPLPLISKGGTSVLITSTFIGMLLGISNTLDRQEAGEQALGGAIDVPEPIEGNESFDDTTK
jgi:cell division protein FtsW